jgi:hypothetical protein
MYSRRSLEESWIVDSKKKLYLALAMVLTMLDLCVSESDYLPVSTYMRHTYTNLYDCKLPTAHFK